MPKLVTKQMRGEGRKASLSPELIESRAAPGTWTIRECEPADAYVSLERREAAIPAEYVLQDTLVKAHELMHTAVSPLKFPGSGDVQTFGARLEEPRVDTLVAETGLPMWAQWEVFDFSGMSAPTDGRVAAMAMSQYYYQVATRPRGNPLPQDFALYWAAVQAAVKAPDGRNVAHMVAAACQEVMAHPRDESVRDAQAEMLATLFTAKVPPKPHQQTQAALEARKAAKELAEQMAEQESLDSCANELKGLEQASLDERGMCAYVGGMAIHDHIRTSRSLKTLANPRGVTDRGVIPTRPERKFTGQVFSKRKPGASILIDTSGSMEWDWDVLKQLIGQLPASVIATHVGVSGCQERGRLCIIAAKGKMATYSPEYDETGGNAVDMEALMWLSKQPAPRVWLSDGDAHSSAMYPTTRALWAAIDRFMVRNKILRVESAEDALALVRGKAARASTGSSNMPLGIRKMPR